MDAAVVLVEAYLRLNGYFTVAEYPVLEATRRAGVRTVTDLDILAVRFPRGAGPAAMRRRARNAAPLNGPDPALRTDPTRVDMLVGEVKRGPAQLNAATHDPLVLEAMLARYGCCGPADVPGVVQALLRTGRTVTPCGHVVRLVAFGLAGDCAVPGAHAVVDLARVVDFLERRLRSEWEVLRHAQFGETALGILATIERARHGRAVAPPPGA